jgi:hypothetical protein
MGAFFPDSKLNPGERVTCWLARLSVPNPTE